jgi:hypothetical protein
VAKIEPPYILYWDVESQTMLAGAWTTHGGIVTSENQLFFQLGSVVGFTNNMDAWGTDKIMFNPTSTATASLTWATIPNWINWFAASGTTYDSATHTVDGYISSSDYHTLDNVKDGRGDPCKLVGLTVDQVKAGVIDNKTYRLPTQAENASTYGSPTYYAGNGWISGATPIAGIYTSAGIATTFLPASGYRTFSDGSTSGVGRWGFYWSSTPNNSTYGYNLHFINGGTNPVFTYDARYGMAVRCVAQ